MERALDLTVPGNGHSLIRGLGTAGQWFRRELYCLQTWITGCNFPCQQRRYADSSNLYVDQSPFLLPSVIYCQMCSWRSQPNIWLVTS